MTEWWTYRLSDFLMFSPRAYWRLVELYNQELWPAHFLALAAGAGALALAWRARLPRVVPAVLAIAWSWAAWSFLWQRYAQINWGAHYLAGAFAAQALMLLSMAAVQPGSAPTTGSRRIGAALALLGLAYPATAVLWGRPLAQAETFALMPDPTALLTMGVLLMLPLAPWLRRAGLVIPVLSLSAGAATHWAMAG
jgi:signal transduction histidine kinase